MGNIKNFVFEQKCVPWRVRHGYQTFLENSVYNRNINLYRKLRLGRMASTTFRLSPAGGHYFFGYYEKNPWNQDRLRHLAHKAAFMDRPPTENDFVEIGLLNINKPGRFEPVTRTSAWNWQQGSMLRWHPGKVNTILFNDRRDGRFTAVSLNIDTGEERVYSRAFYDVSPDGTYALSLNFSRLHIHRPGYGYVGPADPFAGQAAPREDGIFRVDLDSGEESLIVSLAELGEVDPLPEMNGQQQFFNHIQISPGGNRFGFFHNWADEKGGWYPRLFTAEADGSGRFHLLSGGVVSHYDWRDDKSLLIWGWRKQDVARFYLLKDGTDQAEIVGERVMMEDGHCSYSPNRDWVLNDTYPDHFSKRTLFLYDLKTGRRINLERLYSPRACGEIRCDFHPRWHPSGRVISFDSLHEGYRGIYVTDISRFVRRS